MVKSCGAAVVWVSHDPDQPARVGGRILNLPLGNESAVGSPPLSPDPSPAKRGKLVGVNGADDAAV